MLLMNILKNFTVGVLLKLINLNKLIYTILKIYNYVNIN